jgi:hypothetical protein
MHVAPVLQVSPFVPEQQGWFAAPQGTQALLEHTVPDGQSELLEQAQVPVDEHPSEQQYCALALPQTCDGAVQQAKVVLVGW